jgi:hypothetical protein
MRISKPLIGTAAGAAVLGATLAYGLSAASAATGHTTAARTSHSLAAAASRSAKTAAAPARKAHHTCPHMSGAGSSAGSGRAG